MAGQDRNNSNMSVDVIELSKVTLRGTSMSMAPGTSYERENASIFHTGPLHDQRATDLGVTGNGASYGDKRSDSHRPLRGKNHNSSHADAPKELSESNFANDNYVEKNEHLSRSGPLGLCNDPDCTDCPPAYKAKKSNQRGSAFLNSKFPSIRLGDAPAKKSVSYLPILNPHTKAVQRWNKFFVMSCILAIFIDPLFFFLLSVKKEDKCIVFNWSLATAFSVVRSLTDFIYFLHMLLQFRLAYVAPESRVVGAGDLVDQPKKIARHYLHGYFIFDLFVVLPLPQIMILVVIPDYVGSSEANYAKNLLRIIVLVQYIPRIIRFLPFLAGQSEIGFIFETAWANFIINLLMFILSGHVVGSCWYLFGLQRVNQCLHDACSASNIKNCKLFMDCGRGDGVEQTDLDQYKQQWLNDTASTGCFNPTGDFQYGIYQQVVLLTTKHSVVKRYVYALFWGFQQISTLAGNLVPSYFLWEVLFTMGIIGLGLLLFALLIGNIQNFLQALGKRRLEMQLRRRDVERWMNHRRLPEDLKSKVRQAERFIWVATRGVNEEELVENLPEDIQREIRRHYFQVLKKVRIFTLLEEPVIDAICEKLRQKMYIKGSKILYSGGPLEKMVFVLRGKLESIGADGNKHSLSEGDVCGEELLSWCIEHSTNKEGGNIRSSRQRLFSTRTIRCITNVEAFALRAIDLEEVTKLFSRFFRNPRVQAALRYESSYYKSRAATSIQTAWKYRQWRRKRAVTLTAGAGTSRLHDQS